MTPDLLLCPGAVAIDKLFVGVLTLDPAEGGDSDPARLFDWAEIGVITGVCTKEFFRPPFFDERVAALPTGNDPLPRLRFLMTSVFRDKGRTTP
jgi:hypothetical protein